MNISAVANVFYSAATFGNVAQAASVAGQMPPPELQPFGEGLAILNPDAGARFLVALEGELQDRVDLIAEREPGDLQKITGLIATSDGPTAHLFKTPETILSQVREIIRGAQTTRSPAKNFLPHIPPPTDEVLKKIFPSEKNLQKLMEKSVREILDQYPLEEAITLFIDEYLSMQNHLTVATTDFGYDYLVLMQKMLKQTVAEALRHKIPEVLQKCVKWMASTDGKDPKAWAAVTFVAAFGEGALESLKNAWTLARQADEETGGAIAARLMLVFEEIGQASLPVLEKMKQLYPDNVDFFDVSIQEIQRT